MRIYIKNSQRAINLNQRRIRRDLRRALRLLRFQTAELSVLFVGGKRMRRLNALYRGIDRPTDVLSFPLLEGGTTGEPALLGDIVICVPKAAAQAKEYSVRFYDELLRLLVHGLLHLLGYEHERNSSQRKRMERKERELLHALKTMA